MLDGDEEKNILIKYMVQLGGKNYLWEVTELFQIQQKKITTFSTFL